MIVSGFQGFNNIFILSYVHVEGDKYMSVCERNSLAGLVNCFKFEENIFSFLHEVLCLLFSSSEWLNDYLCVNRSQAHRSCRNWCAPATIVVSTSPGEGFICRPGALSLSSSRKLRSRSFLIRWPLLFCVWIDNIGMCEFDICCRVGTYRSVIGTCPSFSFY